MSKFLIVVEETETGYSAYSPDLPGCVATGKTKPAVERMMAEAIDLHLEGLREDGATLPTAHSYSTYCEVPA